MNIIADTHIHFYPCYDLKRALMVLRSNLADLGPDCTHLAFLAERYDCHYFQEIRDKKQEISSSSVQINDLGEALLLQEEGYNDLFLFAGRQVITRERLEVLALTMNTEIPDGAKFCLECGSNVSSVSGQSGDDSLGSLVVHFYKLW